MKPNVHGVWVAQSGRKMLKVIGILLVINSIRHNIILTSTKLGQSFNFSYYKLGITKKKKKWMQIENCNRKLYSIYFEIKGMPILLTSQKETISESLNYIKWTCLK